VCLGKGLGGGLPVSACLGAGEAMACWGSHGGATLHTATHFGAPVACAAAVATLEVLAESGLPQRARLLGPPWMGRLRERLRGCGVNEVRGQGLMVGVALDGGARRALAATRQLLTRGWIVLTGGAKGDVLTLTPPLDIEESLLDQFVEALYAALRNAPR
jgi:4-aminobutyrate aminotransferase/(S)-3-amino-2-methylpropionate transaminase